jgi:hypothetical protein
MLIYNIPMPLQKKKKKKPAKEKSKTPAVSQKVTQIVRVNVGDVKPKPRRRRAPAKKKEQPFGFGGGGGSGLAQVVSAPSATNEVLQQSKELREIVNKLQTSPAQQTLRGAEQGGQAERTIAPDDMPVSRGQFRGIMGEFMGYQGEQLNLAGERMEALNKAIHALSNPAEPVVTELHTPSPTPVDTIIEPAVTLPQRRPPLSPVASETEDESPSIIADPSPSKRPPRGAAVSAAKKQEVIDAYIKKTKAETIAKDTGLNLNTTRSIIKKYRASQKGASE